MKKPILLIILIIAVVLPAFSQRVLKDIAQGTDNAWIFQSGSFSSNDTLYFKANSLRDNKYNYYLTTGATVSTRVLPTADYQSFGYIHNYQTSSSFKFKNKLFIHFQNTLYAIKNDSLIPIKYFPTTYYSYGFCNSFELNGTMNFILYDIEHKTYNFWKTDGTENGTVLYKSIPVNDIALGTGLMFNNKYYQFIYDDAPSIIITDGTTNGTTVIKNHKITLQGHLTFGSKMYFTKLGTGPYYYRTKLWESKGDSISTRQVLSQIDGDTSYATSNLFKFKNNLYFTNYSNYQQRISRLDTNTLTATDVTRTIFDWRCFAFGNQKFYYGLMEGNQLNIYENSGNLASESLIFSLPVTEPDESRFYTLFLGSNKFYVSEQKTRSGGVYGDVVYWVYDGIALKKITDLNTGITLGLFNNAVGTVGDIFYFSAADSQHGYELWRTNGTVEGTFMVKDVNKEIASSNPTILFPLNNQLYFMADDISHGIELWRTNGVNTNLFADLNQGGSGDHVLSSYLMGFTKFRSDYMINFTFSHFKISSDGTINHLPFLPVNPLSNLYEFNDSLYFTGNDGNLWKSDGTEIGTKKAVHLDSTANGLGNFGDKILTNVNANLFFTTNYGSAIWRTDGKKSGTVKLHQFLESEVPTDSRYDNYPIWQNTELFFFERRNTSANKIELWRSDGTINGTFKLPANDYIRVLGIYNNKIYFVNNLQLWVSNGTTAGTVKIDDRYFSTAQVLNNRFYLLRNENGVEYHELNVNNNISYLNTVNDFNTDNYSSSKLFLIDNRYLLNIVSTTASHDFYLTDGNKENIKKAFAIKNMGNNSNPFSLTYLNKKIYFTATDSLKGNELWIWDFDCPDGYTIRDNITKDSTIVYGKNIWGQNIVSNNKTVTYDAKNSITLQPGFEAQKGTVFKTKLIGCANNNSSNVIEDDNSDKNEPLVKVNTNAIYPHLIDFLYYLPNKSIKEIYERAERNKLTPITWNIVTEKDIYRLDLKIGSGVFSAFLPKKN